MVRDIGPRKCSKTAPQMKNTAGATARNVCASRRDLSMKEK